MTDRAKRDALDILTGLPAETSRYLAELVRTSASGEEFAAAAVCGPCPRCEGTRTLDCDDVPGIEDPTVALCTTCGYLWCVECRRPLTGTSCAHWDICEKCDDATKDEFGACQIDPSTCERVRVPPAPGGGRLA